MTANAELKMKFWDALSKERTAMLCCTGVYPRPMTAQAENGRGPIWFFTARENDLAQATARKPQEGLMMLVTKDHNLFATVGGTLQQDNNPTVIERLWNPFVDAWYIGKDDPKLRLLRFDPGTAEIWQNESSLIAGIKMLLGADPQESFKGDVAKVRLGKG